MTGLIVTLWQIKAFTVLFSEKQMIDRLFSFQFDRFITQKEVHPEHGGKPFCFITDGPLHFRMCLHAEASRKSIQLPSHFHKYLDIRKEFRKFYKLEVINCIKDMLECILSSTTRLVQTNSSYLHRTHSHTHTYTHTQESNLQESILSGEGEGRLYSAIFSIPPPPFILQQIEI